MKKTYINPVTEVVSTELANIVCASGNTYKLTTSAEWGGEGEYAPGEWITEEQIDGSIGGYSTSTIEETNGDFASRSKGWSGWDTNW